MALKAETQIPAQFNYWTEKLISSVTTGLVHDLINPVSGFEARHSGTLKFHIPGNENFTDLNNSFIKLVLKITGTGQGTGIDASMAKILTTGLGPINNIAHSIFQSVRVKLGGQEITLSDNNYPYKAYLQLLTETSKEAQRTYFEVTGWRKDTAGKMDETSITEDSSTKLLSCANEGLLYRRQNYFDEATATGEFMIKPHTGICFQNLAIFPFADIEFELTRHDNPKFYLMSKMDDDKQDFKIEILEATYIVRRNTVQASFLANLEKMLAVHPAQFIFPDVHSTPYTISSNVSNYINENLFHGNVPRKINFVMVASDAYNGTGKKNPFSFHHFNLTSMRLLKNGIPFPWPETKMNFTSTPKQVTEAYHKLFTASGAEYSDQVINITRAEFANGYTILSNLMTNDQNFFIDQNAMSMNRPSQIKIELRFSQNLQESVQLIALYESFTIVTMDNLRRFLVEHQ